MTFSPVTRFSATLEKKLKVSAKCYELDFKLNNIELDFKAGQYISIIITEKVRRSYSLYSSPLESKSKISLLTDVSIGGPGSVFFENLKLQENCDMLGPLGHFMLPESLYENLIFIATGSGIAPINSMIETLIKLNCKSNIILYFGTSHNANVINYKKYNDYFNKGLIKDYKLAISRENPEYNNGIKGRVTDLLKNNIISNAHYFVCGSGSMNDSVVEMLLTHGINETNIFYEKFFF